MLTLDEAKILAHIKQHRPIGYQIIRYYLGYQLDFIKQTVSKLLDLELIDREPEQPGMTISRHY